MRLIDAEELKKNIMAYKTMPEIRKAICEVIDDAPTVEITEEQAIDKLHETGWLPNHDKEMTTRPQGKWYDCITPNCLKARHGDYVLYKVDFLLGNLAREVYTMEGVRRMKGGLE